MRLLGQLHPRRTAPLAALAILVALLGGCGDSADGGGTTGDSSSSPGPEASDPVDNPQSETVAILSATAAGGSTEAGVFRLDQPGGVEELLGTLNQRGRQLAEQLRQVVGETEVPDGMALVGGVVAIGCDVPSDVKVGVGADGQPELTPDWTGVKRLQECFAPVTSVAVVLVRR